MHEIQLYKMGKKTQNNFSNLVKRKFPHNQQPPSTERSIAIKKKSIMKKQQSRLVHSQRTYIDDFCCDSGNSQKENQDLECPICMEVYIYPIRFPCDHSFCLPCIDKMVFYQQINRRCSICRASLSDNSNPLQINQELTSRLHDFQAKLIKPEQKQVYNQRLKSYQLSIQKWTIKPQNISVAMQLDVRIGNSWKRGKILEKYICNEEEMIKVQHEGFQQQFRLRTCQYWNLAKYRFHTINLFDTPQQFIHENRTNVPHPLPQIRNSTANNQMNQQQNYLRSLWRRLDTQPTILPLSIESIDQFL